MMKAASLSLALLLALSTTASAVTDPTCYLYPGKLGGPYRASETVVGSEDVPLCALRMRSSSRFQARFACSSDGGTPAVALRWESSATAVGGYGARSTLVANVTDVADNVALPSTDGWGRIVIDGLPGNASDTLCSVAVEQAEMTLPTPVPTPNVPQAIATALPLWIPTIAAGLSMPTPQPTFAYVAPTPMAFPTAVPTLPPFVYVAPTPQTFPTAVPTAWPTPMTVVATPTPFVFPTPVPTHTHAPAPTVLSGSATIDPPNTSSNACADMTPTIAVAGAVDGDALALGVPGASTFHCAGVSYVARVSAANVVTVRVCKIGTTTCNPPSGTFTARVIR